MRADVRPGSAGRGPGRARGAPRWKQRALYDAVKDAAASVPGGPRLVRLAVHDEIGGVSLGAVLEGRGRVAPGDLRALVEERTA